MTMNERQRRILAMVKADAWLSPYRAEVEQAMVDSDRKAARKLVVLTRRQGRIIKRTERSL